MVVVPDPYLLNPDPGVAESGSSPDLNPDLRPNLDEGFLMMKCKNVPYTEIFFEKQRFISSYTDKKGRSCCRRSLQRALQT